MASLHVENGPIFVVGAPRSGTTLLQLILDAHPLVGMQGELHFFDQINQLRESWPSVICKENLQTFYRGLERLAAFQYLPELNRHLGWTTEQLLHAGGSSLEDFFRCMVAAPARLAGKPWWGEKTPENVRYLADLVEIFPNAKILHIHRDPRAVVASLMQVPWAPDSVLINALKWKIDMLYADEFLKAGGRLHELAYEELITDPRACLQRVCDFIGVDFDERMLAFHRSAGDRLQGEAWKDGTLQPVNASSREKWTTVLSRPESRLVEILAGSLTEMRPSKTEGVGLLSLLGCTVRDLGRYLGERRRRKEAGSAGVIEGEEGRLRARLVQALLQRSRKH